MYIYSLPLQIGKIIISYQEKESSSHKPNLGYSNLDNNGICGTKDLLVKKIVSGNINWSIYPIIKR